jgi:hypothetical protein
LHWRNWGTAIFRIETKSVAGIVDLCFNILFIWLLRRVNGKLQATTHLRSFTFLQLVWTKNTTRLRTYEYILGTCNENP